MDLGYLARCQCSVNGTSDEQESLVNATSPEMSQMEGRCRETPHVG